jgi:MFS family permease
VAEDLTSRVDLASVARLDALALTAAIWFLAKLLRYAFPPLFGTLQDVYGVSNAVIGGAFSALMLVYAAMQFPSGALADRLGAGRVIAAGATVGGIGAVSLLVNGPFALLVAGMLLFGLGTGAHKTVAVRLMARVYPSRTGRALGVMDTVGAFGGVVAPAAVVLLLPDWRALFVAGGVAALALAAAFLVRVPEREPDPPATGSDDGEASLRGYLVPFADPRFAAFAVAVVLFTFATGGVIAFLPLFLTDVAGLSTGVAGTLYSALFAGSVGQLLTGELSDRLPRLGVIVATVLLTTLGIVGVIATPSLPLLAAAVVAFGVGKHGIIPVRGAYFMAAIPDDVAGGTLGVVRTSFMGASALAPAAVGVVADLADLTTAFVGLAAVMTAALVVLLGLFAAGGAE